MHREPPLPPERIAELAEPLGEEAREILGRLLEAEAMPQEKRPKPAEVLEGFDKLPQEDKDLLLRIYQEFDEAHARKQEEARGMASLSRQLKSIVERAQELDSLLAARRDNVTVGEAVAVLEARGEKLGINKEALDIELMIPEIKKKKG